MAEDKNSLLNTQKQRKRKIKLAELKTHFIHNTHITQLLSAIYLEVQPVAFPSLQE